MDAELSELVNRLSNPEFTDASVIDWGSPVPSFGDLTKSKIATIGLNPSNREFVDVEGNELDGDRRRFHTLHSLGISNWTELDHEQLNAMIELCKEYFSRNPYDGWFKKLDYVISGTNISYYFPSFQACHLDLIPYATACKWTDLTPNQKSILLELSGDMLGVLLKHSPIELIVLNGKSVIDNFQRISDAEFNIKEMPSWKLSRKDSDGVIGYSYSGHVKEIGGIKLPREVKVLGYNHNIQSSFGVTSEVLKSIRNWVAHSSKEIFA